MTRIPPSSRLVDVSHTVEHGMVTYKGLPAPIICDYLSRAASRERYAPGTEFQIGKIEMVANTGTYVDSPFHRYPDGKDLAALPLESLADLDCVVVRVPEGQGPRDRSPRPDRTRRARSRGAGTHGMGPALAHRPILREAPAPHRRAGGVAGCRRVRCWWASIRSTSTASIPGSGRCTRSCWATTSRSWSTCATWRAFRSAARSSLRCR